MEKFEKLGKGLAVVAIWVGASIACAVTGNAEPLGFAVAGTFVVGFFF